MTITGGTVRENIFVALQDLLADITTGNGYVNTIQSVQRWSPSANVLNNTPTIVISSGPETREESPNPLTTCTLSIFLDLWVRQAEDDATPTDTLLNSILGDIIEAINSDRTLDGYAIDTNFKNIVPFETIQGQPSSGLVIELEILYRHLQTDPTEIG